jgi:hypothetical protein
MQAVELDFSRIYEATVAAGPRLELLPEVHASGEI